MLSRMDKRRNASRSRWNRKKGTKKWKKVKTKRAKRTIKKLKRKKRYQIQARAYKVVNKKTYYGAWSKVKTSKKIK